MNCDTLYVVISTKAAATKASIPISLAQSATDWQGKQDTNHEKFPESGSRSKRHERGGAVHSPKNAEADAQPRGGIHGADVTIPKERELTERE